MEADEDKGDRTAVPAYYIFLAFSLLFPPSTNLSTSVRLSNDNYLSR